MKSYCPPCVLKPPPVSCLCLSLARLRRFSFSSLLRCFHYSKLRLLLVFVLSERDFQWMFAATSPLRSLFILLRLPQRVWPESILIPDFFCSARPAPLKHHSSSCTSLANKKIIVHIAAIEDLVGSVSALLLIQLFTLARYIYIFMYLSVKYLMLRCTNLNETVWKYSLEISL